MWRIGSVKFRCAEGMENIMESVKNDEVSVWA